jgi:hypothetical protein
VAASYWNHGPAAAIVGQAYQDIQLNQTRRLVAGTILHHDKSRLDSLETNLPYITLPEFQTLE